MKKTILLSLLFAFASFSHNVITSFANGDYLGQGNYHSTLGEDGEYRSYNFIRNNLWHNSMVLDDGTYSFHHDTTFTFDDNGFFTVWLVDHVKGVDDNGNPTQDDYYYFGEGYCMTYQCHYWVDLGDIGYSEETITFHPVNNAIYKLGSFTYYDIYGYPVTIAYEEALDYIEPHDPSTHNE